MFPSLPSGNNPYTGAAAGYAGASASVLNALDAAVNQHASRQAATKRQADVDATTAAQRDFENQRQMMTEGAVPTQTYGGDSQPTPGRPTLRTAEPNPDAQGEGQQVTDPSGKTWYVPTQGEKDKKSGKTFIPTGGLASALQAGGAWDGKTPISAEQSHSLMMSLNEAQPKDEPWDLDTSGKFLDANGKPAAVMIGKKTKTVQALNLSGAQPSQPNAAQGTPGSAPGGAFDQSQLPPEGSPLRGTGPSGMTPPANGATPGGPFTFSPTSKMDAQQMLEGVTGPKGGKLVWDKNKNTISEVEMPAGSKGTLTAAQAEADKDRHVRQSELQDARDSRQEEMQWKRSDAQQVRENQAAKDHEAAGVKKQAMQAMAQGFHDAAGTNAGETYFPPRYVNGIVTPGPASLMPTDAGQLADRRKALETAAGGFEQTAKTHQAEQERIEKAHGWGKFAPTGAAAPTPKPAATQPAQPVAATPAEPAAAPATKKYSAKDITAWAKANGKDPADALARAKKNGLL